MAERTFKPETLAIHAGQIPDSATGARALPIYQTTSFVFDSAEHAANLFNLATFGNVYSRLSNPTVAALEERVAALEGGRAAVASASGMAAEAMALMTMLQAGDHVIAAGALYGGTVTMLAVNLKKFGIETTFVDATRARSLRRRDAAEHARGVRREPGQPEPGGARHRRGGRGGARARRAAGDRQHRAEPVPVQPDPATAPTSSCTRPPSTSAATAPRWPAWWSRAASSRGTTASSPA